MAYFFFGDEFLILSDVLLNPFTYRYIRKTFSHGFKKVYFFSKKKPSQSEELDIQ
jgi:hypothetical protein